MNNILIGNVISVISIALALYSRWHKTKRVILMWESISNCVGVISYLFLKAYDGIALSIIATLRNLVVCKITHKKIFFTVLTLSMTAAFYCTWTYPNTIFVALGGYCNAFAAVFCKERRMRLLNLASMVPGIAYDICIHNYVALCYTVMSLISGTLAFIKYERKKEE